MISELLPRSFRLSWNSPPKEHANGIIRKYIVNITEKYGQNVLIEEFFNTTTEIPSLHPHTVYLVSVSAFTIAEGPQSPVIEVLTLEDGKFNFRYYACMLLQNPGHEVYIANSE